MESRKWETSKIFWLVDKVSYAVSERWIYPSVYNWSFNITTYDERMYFACRLLFFRMTRKLFVHLCIVSVLFFCHYKTRQPRKIFIHSPCPTLTVLYAPNFHYWSTWTLTHRLDNETASTVLMKKKDQKTCICL
jgi:hypothetical protein